MFRVIDNRNRLEIVDFNSKINLLPHQQSAIEKVIDKDFGVIVSPPGSGKTIIGLEIIAQKMQPALILVHRKQIFDQWIDRIQTSLKYLHQKSDKLVIRSLRSEKRLLSQ